MCFDPLLSLAIISSSATTSIFTHVTAAAIFRLAAAAAARMFRRHMATAVVGELSAALESSRRIVTEVKAAAELSHNALAVDIAQT